MQDHPPTEPNAEPAAAPDGGQAAGADDQAPAPPKLAAPPPGWTYEDRQVMRQRAHARYPHRPG
jgi:hypothetical protein